MKYKCRAKTCGHIWEAKVSKKFPNRIPKSCPKCKQYKVEIYG